MIVYRLHTIMVSDRILVLDNGNIIKLQLPNQLIAQPNKRFMEMLSTIGNVDETT